MRETQPVGTSGVLPSPYRLRPHVRRVMWNVRMIIPQEQSESL
jgi:hypothetical protein